MKKTYLDNASNTKLDPQVFQAMKPYLKNFVGNSASTHEYGVRASQVIEQSRFKIAKLLGYRHDEVFFTSGATESNNTIIKSLALHELFHSTRKVPKKHIIVSAIEHSSILQACKEIETWGFEITYLTPTPSGIIRYAQVKNALRKDTLLVCIMGINNELGSYNDIDLIGRAVKQNCSYMMSDCTQLIGSYISNKTTPFSVKYRYVDFITFSAHKLYGPIGVGIMIIKKLNHIDPLLNGGSQEFGMRGGTTNVAGIVGLAKAIEILYHSKSYDHYVELYNYLIEKLDSNNINYKINGKSLYKNIISLTIQGLYSDKLADEYACYNVAVSAGSACDNTHNELKGDFNPSHVLKAIGMCDDDIKNTIRLSFSKFTTKKDIDLFIKATNSMIEERKKINENLSSSDN